MSLTNQEAFELTVLQFLNKHDEVSGVDLRQHVRAQLGVMAAERTGFYERIVTMEAMGWLKSRSVPVVINGEELNDHRYSLNREKGTDRLTELLKKKFESARGQERPDGGFSIA